MIKITIPLKAISINCAFQGRRFKTKTCKAFEKSALSFLPICQNPIKGWIDISYTFYLKNWKRTDADNLVKVFQDLIVRQGYIEDDRKIMRYAIEKVPSKEDKTEIMINQYYLIGGEK